MCAEVLPIPSIDHLACHRVATMLPMVYIETSVISYLTARPSRDLVTAAHQRLTLEWWAHIRPAFTSVVSELVVQEAALGDPELATRRLGALDGLPILAVTVAGRELARSLLQESAIPENAIADALHIAIAAEHRSAYLLTWNCKHIANARARHAIERTLRAAGYDPPILCTPEELRDR